MRTSQSRTEPSFHPSSKFSLESGARADGERASRRSEAEDILVVGGRQVLDPAEEAFLQEVANIFGLGQGCYRSIYARLVPGARVKIIPECGHLPQIEQTEAFLEGVLEITNGTRP